MGKDFFSHVESVREAILDWDDNRLDRAAGHWVAVPSVRLCAGGGEWARNSV